MVVKMKPGSDAVRARITVTGMVTWAYLLSSPDHTYKKSGTSNAPTLFALGLPADLQLDPHEWTFHLANLANATVGYKTVVEFVQGKANTVIGTWSKSGRLKSGDEVILEDRAVLFISLSEVV